MSDVLVKPAFQSAAIDSGDATKLGPNAWNAARLFSGGNEGDVISRAAASATGAAWITWPLPSVFVVGDLLYASSTSALSRLADVASGQFLMSGGVGVAPAWSSVLTWNGSDISMNSVNGQRLALNGNGALYFIGRSQFQSPADGQFNVLNNAGSVGVGIDVATDGVFKFRTRAQTGYATVDALGYKASGVAGVSFTGAVATLTVVNGIVTGHT